MRFHHLETRGCQPYGSALFSAPWGSNGISCVLVGAPSGEFLQILKSDYSSQGLYLEGNKGKWEGNGRKMKSKDKEEGLCICMCVRVCARVHMCVCVYLERGR